MGANHARIARQVPGARVRWVVDPEETRGRRLAVASQATWLPSVDQLRLDDVGAAVIAAPTELHRELACAFLLAGVPVLLEKPIANTLEDSDAILGAAEATGATLMIGHVERFNPVIMKLSELLDHPIHIDVNRTSSFSSRVTCSVVLDLMIHDLDIVLAATGSVVASFSVVGQQTRGSSVDLASVVLRFKSGVTAALTASRIGQGKVRSLSITQRDSVLTADLLRQDLQIDRVEFAEYLSEAGSRYRQSTMIEIPFVEQRGEPLFAEMTHFLDSVRNGAVPLVTGEAGHAALKLALRIESGIEVPG